MAFVTPKAQREFNAHITADFLDLDAVAEWIGDHMDPEDVFPDDKLEKWAEANGLKRPED